MWFVCVWRGQNTQSLLSLLLFTSRAAHRNLPVAACSSLVHTHKDRHTASVPACTSRQWVAVVAASSRRGQLCLTSGLDSIQTIRESLTGSLDEIIEWGVRVQACAVRFSVFIYFFPLWGVLLHSATALGHTNHCDKFSVVSKISQKPLLSNVELCSFFERWREVYALSQTALGTLF